MHIWLIHRRANRECAPVRILNFHINILSTAKLPSGVLQYGKKTECNPHRSIYRNTIWNVQYLHLISSIPVPLERGSPITLYCLTSGIWLRKVFVAKHRCAIGTERNRPMYKVENDRKVTQSEMQRWEPLTSFRLSLGTIYLMKFFINWIRPIIWHSQMHNFTFGLLSLWLFLTNMHIIGCHFLILTSYIRPPIVAAKLKTVEQIEN